jgi:hypothetical protein
VVFEVRLLVVIQYICILKEAELSLKDGFYSYHCFVMLLIIVFQYSYLSKIIKKLVRFLGLIKTKIEEYQFGE